MLVETWVAVPLRAHVAAVPPSGPNAWWEGVANWLLEGGWASRVAEPVLGAGGAGALVHRAIKAIDPEARVVLGDGALAPLDSAGIAAPVDGGEAVPEAWDSGWVDGTARATLRTGPLAATVTARYAARTRAEVPALRLVVRGVWAELLPAADGDDAAYETELARAFRRPGAVRDLRDLLADAGDQLGSRLSAAFAGETDAPPEVRTHVRVFERTDGLEDVLRGLPAGALRHVRVVGEWFRTGRPPVEVVRRRRDGVVELWRGDPDLAVPGGEVADAR